MHSSMCMHTHIYIYVYSAHVGKWISSTIAACPIKNVDFHIPKELVVCVCYPVAFWLQLYKSMLFVCMHQDTSTIPFFRADNREVAANACSRDAQGKRTDQEGAMEG